MAATDRDYGVAREVRASVERDGIALVRALYDLLDDYNRDHFGGRLPPVVLMLAATSSPRALGDHTAQDEQGISYRVRIHPKVPASGGKYTADVLLHELVHVAMNFAGHPERGYRGHGPEFAAACNAIGRSMGLPPVAEKGRKGVPDCAQWPLNVRPAGYYGPEAARRALPGVKPSREEEEGSGEEEEEEEEGSGEEEEEKDPAGEIERAISELEAGQLKAAINVLRRIRRDLEAAIAGLRGPASVTPAAILQRAIGDVKLAIVAVEGGRAKGALVILRHMTRAK